MPVIPPKERLARLAAGLQPAERPYYIASADRRHMAVGWYWRPAGVEHPAFLGHNHVVAEMTLHKLLDRLEAA